MIFSSRQLAQAVLEMQEDGMSQELAIEKLFAFLKKKRKQYLISDVLHALIDLEEKKTSSLQVRITSAFPIGDTAFIEKKAMSLFSAKEYDFAYYLQPDLMGGVVIEADQKKWDGSVKKTLQALKDIL